MENEVSDLIFSHVERVMIHECRDFSKPVRFAHRPQVFEIAHAVGRRREERPRRRRLLSSLSGPREVLPLLFLRQNYADGFCTPLLPPFAKIAARGGLKETISSGMEWNARLQNGNEGRASKNGVAAAFVFIRESGRFKWAIS